MDDCVGLKVETTASVDRANFVHRYEVNPEMVPDLEEHGLRFVGKDETGTRMEVVELQGHKFFVATQFHPEFKSRPFKPSPLFLGFVMAAAGTLDNREWPLMRIFHGCVLARCTSVTLFTQGVYLGNTCKVY